MREQFHDRPYDPDQLTNLTAHILSQQEDQRGVISPVSPEAISIEPMPERFSEARVALSGLSKTFSAEGRTERLMKKASRLQHHLNVVRAVGESIDNPRTAQRDPLEVPKERTGWVGTHKKELGSRWRPEDYSNMGKQLFRKKAPGTPRPYPYRPTTLSERFASWRQEAHTRKYRAAANGAKWLRNTGDLSAQDENYRLSKRERAHSAKIIGRAGRLERKAARAKSRFNKVTRSDDLLGRITQRRLQRVQNKIVRMEERRP